MATETPKWTQGMGLGKVQRAILAVLNDGHTRPARDIASGTGHLDAKGRVAASFTKALRVLVGDGLVVCQQETLRGRVYRAVTTDKERVTDGK